MPQIPENFFPKFSAGDTAFKALDHKFLNSLTTSVGNLSQRTTGQPGIFNQVGEFKPPILPGADVRLVKVLDIGTPGTGAFTAPGKVNVVKVELIDATFPEEVGNQDLSEVDAAERFVYAAASTAITLAVDDFTWAVKWSGQWWILSGGGGGGGEGLMMFSPTEVCPGIGFTCDCVLAEVITPACNSSLEVGDEVQVWDVAQDAFMMPPALLFNSIGFATYMKVHEAYGEELPYGLVDGDCRWVVTRMSCVEQ